jgi:hypothetical protein
MSMIATNGPTLLPIAFANPESLQSDWNVEESVFQTYGVEEKLCGLLFEVNLLTMQVSLNTDSSLALEGSILLSRLTSVLQRLLQFSIPDRLSSTDNLSESCRHAGALHILFPLMGRYPDPTLMVNALVHKLKSSLVEYILSSDANPVLLWCLAVGAVSAYKMPEADWFIGNLVKTVAEMDIENWDEMRNYLIGVMSHAVFCDDSFQLVCTKVMARRNT